MNPTAGSSLPFYKDPYSIMVAIVLGVVPSVFPAYVESNEISINGSVG
jgi:hypothetical protein